MAKKMSKTKSPRSKRKKLAYKSILHFSLGIILGGTLLTSASFLIIFLFEQQFKNRVYPGIMVAHLPVGGQTSQQIINYWLTKNNQFQNLSFTFNYEDHMATLSGKALDIGYDATLSATQAMQVGRSGQWLSDLYLKYQAWKQGVDLPPLFNWKHEVFDDMANRLAQEINIEPQNALFEFNNGRVTVFKPAQNGQVVDADALRQQFMQTLQTIDNQATTAAQFAFTIPVAPREATIKTEQANNYGVKELIGSGQSYFHGSIPGRVHNVALAAGRINGVLIPPGETFSFNDAVGDISAATGYKQAYVIKSGRTVLDDGGGVCQVSTTLFRAALNAGLAIVERHAHSYRVGYYEQGGFKPGFDATVYSPSYDLKIKNDTSNHILIQSYTDLNNLSLTFELYGTKDSRLVEISSVKLWDFEPAPPDLNQDDPTLPKNEVKQVDWANPGIKASFDYAVRKDGQELSKKSFYSSYIPWQAVYLHGTK